jgi:hypothetical protein
MKVEARHPPVRGDVLILFSDRFMQAFDLDLARQPRHLTRVQQTAAMGVQRFDQRGRETARGSEACARRDFREGGDLDLRRRFIIRNASRRIGWRTSSTVSTFSMSEYLSRMPAPNGRLMVT